MTQTTAAKIAQDEQTCDVFGMPKEAFRLARVPRVFPLPDTAPHALRACISGGFDAD